MRLEAVLEGVIAAHEDVARGCRTYASNPVCHAVTRGARPPLPGQTRYLRSPPHLAGQADLQDDGGVPPQIPLKDHHTYTRSQALTRLLAVPSGAACGWRCVGLASDRRDGTGRQRADQARHGVPCTCHTTGEQRATVGSQDRLAPARLRSTAPVIHICKAGV